mgnify:CR=1 FL=1
MTAASILHRVWHLGDDVDTDALAPGAWMQHGVDVIAQHCLENVVPDFAAQVRAGDVIVAGRNFGIGSSREQAAEALVLLGVAAVIAPNYGGLFFRNAFNLGLVLLTCPAAGRIDGYDRVQLDLKSPAVTLPSGERLACEAIPEFLLRMAQAGGLMASLKLRMTSDPTSFNPCPTSRPETP